MTELWSINMSRFNRLLVLFVASLATALFSAPAPAQNAPTIGIVIMHGKGGRPERFVSVLAEGLERKGWLVANIEMPWSGRREYDDDIAGAEQQVTAALNELRSKGAKKVFVAGHSQGGVFALYYASRNPLDGVIPMAPGGSVDATVYTQNVGGALALAQRMVADGKGAERGVFKDYESSRGVNDIHTTAATYVTWFDPNGAMNQGKSSRAIPATTPVLYIAPRNDYPGLVRFKSSMFAALPSNPLTRMADIEGDHLNAPGNSIDTIARWVGEVVAK
jgi:pimeloyl-ACP methyl ester carboxylesterase